MEFGYFIREKSQLSLVYFSRDVTQLGDLYDLYVSIK